MYSMSPQSIVLNAVRMYVECGTQSTLYTPIFSGGFSVIEILKVGVDHAFKCSESYRLIPQ